MKYRPRTVYKGPIVLAAGIIVLLILPHIQLSAGVIDVDDLIFQGADAHYKGNLSGAVTSFEAALKIDPQNEFAHNQLGILYAKQNKFESAGQEFSIVAGLDERNTFAQLWLGILHLQKQEVNLAYERFEKIVQIDPLNADAYYFLGTICVVRRKPALAIEFLKKARDADSDEADTHFRLAKAFHNVDMIANAMLEYRRALEIRPTCTKAINEIGWIYYNQGDRINAIAQWERTLKINRRDRNAADNLARAYNDLAWEAFRTGNKDVAVKNWRKALKIDPGNKAAKFYLSNYGS